MNTEKQARLELLQEESIIWIISIFLAIGALTSSILETEDVKNNNNKNRRTWRTLNIIIFIIALLINLYFLNLSYHEYKKTNNKRFILNIIGSALASIGVTLFLIAELIVIKAEKEE